MCGRSAASRPTRSGRSSSSIVERETERSRTARATWPACRPRLDAAYRRSDEQLAKLKDELAKLPKDEGQEAAALTTLKSQIGNLERQLAAVRQRYEGNAAQLVYGDILWGLFNSTEFTFNH